MNGHVGGQGKQPSRGIEKREVSTLVLREERLNNLCERSGARKRLLRKKEKGGGLSQGKSPFISLRGESLQSRRRWLERGECIPVKERGEWGHCARLEEGRGPTAQREESIARQKA